MSKDIKDYLHLYLGCEVLVLDLDGQTFKDKIEDVFDRKHGKGFSIYEFGDCPFDNHEEYYQEIKPILRPLSDMSEEEAVECAKIIARRPPNFTAVENADITRHENSIDIVFIDKLDEVVNIGNNGDALIYRHVDMNHRIIEQRCNSQADYFRYLLSKHFDLFNLIPEGLAIDKTTLNQQ